MNAHRQNIIHSGHCPSSPLRIFSFVMVPLGIAHFHLCESPALLCYESCVFSLLCVFCVSRFNPSRGEYRLGGLREDGMRFQQWVPNKNMFTT